MQLPLDLALPATPTLAERVCHAPPPGWAELARRIAADMRAMDREVAA